MNKEGYKCLLISDFNINNLSGYLNNDIVPPRVISTVAPYGQMIPVLMNEGIPCWQNKYDFAVIWTQPENIIKSFSHKMNFEKTSLNKMFKEVDTFSGLLLNICKKVNFVFVPLWVFPTYYRGYGFLDFKNGIGIANALIQINLRLIKNLEKSTQIYSLNTQKWIETVGKHAFNPKLWYMGKVPYGNQVFMEAVKDIKAALQGINGNSKKIIILDLDDTLWGEVVGEVGWKNIKLGGHDHVGEAYVDFQLALKSLTNRGILLGIVSKNEESVAIEAIKKHPEMKLKIDDFAGWKINWRDKVENIMDLVSDLKLGLQSVVFIDDNPVERDRVRQALPEVFVPELPEDKMLYKSFLLSLNCFDAPMISNEDLKRTKMYVSERKRKRLRSKFKSLDEWLMSLNLSIELEELNDINLPRATQLLNKTNQMNLSTRRLTETEFLDWAKQRNHKVWTFRVSDRFGDSGLTGIISLEFKNKIGKIIDFILSCRVVGRKIEEVMLFVIFKYSKKIGLNEIRAEYIPTPKNKLCLEFWRNSGFSHKENSNLFLWKMDKNYPVPEFIQVECKY